jgi:hypothetical protein
MPFREFQISLFRFRLSLNFWSQLVKVIQSTLGDPVIGARGTVKDFCVQIYDPLENQLLIHPTQNSQRLDKSPDKLYMLQISDL